MIAALMLVGLTGWSYWRMHHAAPSPQVIPAINANPRASERPAPTGLKDDPVHWPGAGGSWTALDERQLIRLLKDAAP